jgi:thioredoxin reductase (NADPH)
MSHAVIATAAARGAIAARWDDERIVVVALCAAWCDTCTEFRAAFERIAAARPDVLSIWLDIEDDAAICGEIDVENFPTLAIYRGSSLLHYGVSLPQEATVARLIDAMLQPRRALPGAPEGVRALPNALRVNRAPDR